MDFYIRNFDEVGLGGPKTGAPRYSDKGSFYIVPYDDNYSGVGTIVLNAFQSTNTEGFPHVWTIKYSPYFTNNYSQPYDYVPYYGNSTPNTQVAYVIDDFAGHDVPNPNNRPMFKYQTGQTYYATHTVPEASFTAWYNYSLDTPSTFEEEVCNQFYSTLLHVASPYTQIGVVPNEWNCYIFKLHLTDLDLKMYYAMFTKGNDPAYERIYTGQDIY